MVGNVVSDQRTAFALASWSYIIGMAPTFPTGVVRIAARCSTELTQGTCALEIGKRGDDDVGQPHTNGPFFIAGV